MIRQYTVLFERDEEEGRWIASAQVRLQQGLPFRVNIPTPETEEALREGENPDSLPAYNRFSDLRIER